MAGSEERRPRRPGARWRRAAPTPGLLAALVLAGCGGTGEGAAMGAPTSAQTSAAQTSAAPTSAARTSGPPAGAGSATVVDLDGDGRPDTLWLADVDGVRTLGVTTTGHGTQSVPFTSAAPQAASASAAILQGGQPVVLLDTGRSVLLYGYRVENPGLVELTNPQGQQYTFGLGFTDVGTGLQCRPGDDGLDLYGVDARSGPDERWTVTRTRVVVDVNRSSAHNDATTTVVSGVTADDPAVAGAHGTVCGDDSGVADEPQD
ncbi:hypothetical protein ACFFKU_17950 [Kineococcus gynurae]|uniref:VCBS repeat protein n=1 Tax=Kineococcus gynurae TaxID=452979 RepID=A0ABV5LNH5_9ACTN